MSQYYPPQRPGGYPPPPPPPPQQNPEQNYYYEDAEYDYEEGDDGAAPNYMQLGLSFVAGGCLVFLCMSACLLAAGGLWIADSSLGLGSPTPIPGSDIGLDFAAPAYPLEAVVNDSATQVTILGINRNAQVETIPAVEGREVVIVTIEMVNLGAEDVSFNERDFTLLNSYQEAYAPAAGAIAGSLGRGVLPPNEGLEARLVFEIVTNEVGLVLMWEPPDSTARFLYPE
jgi:hypothetical protein